MIAIPVSQSDIHLLKAQADVLYKFGGLENEVVIVFPSPSVFSDAVEATQQLSDICKRFEVVSIDIEPDGGWPRACNIHFSAVWQKLDAMGNKEPVLWLEPDALPSKYGWPKFWNTDYNRTGKDYKGHLRLTSEVTSPPQDGKHMVGVGMYPGNFTSTNRMWNVIRNDMPFDIWLRWNIAPKCNDTQHLQHLPKSEKFTVEDGKIKGLQDGKDVFVSPQALIVHGCKDGSLAKCLLEVGEVTQGDFKPTYDLPEPEAESTHDPLFQTIKQAIREWDISVPGAYEGEKRAGDAHVKVIVDAVRRVQVVADDVPKEETYKERRARLKAEQPKPTGHLIG